MYFHTCTLVRLLCLSLTQHPDLNNKLLFSGLTQALRDCTRPKLRVTYNTISIHVYQRVQQGLGGKKYWFQEVLLLRSPKSAKYPNMLAHGVSERTQQSKTEKPGGEALGCP